MPKAIAAETFSTARATSTVPLRWTLAALSLSMLMPSLDTSIANIGLPALAASFTASFQEIQWIVLSYLLAITCLIVGAGRLGDLVGRKRLLLAGIALFTAASLACGIAPTLPLLIAARAVQGLGAAIMMALTVALASETVPKSKIGSAMGLLGTMSALGTMLGPSLGGLLIAGAGWRAIFLVNVPLGVVNLFLVRWTLPDNRAASANRPRFDIAGTVLLALALAAYALAMTVTDAFDATLMLAVSATGLVLFVFSQRRASSPLIHLELLSQPALSKSLSLSAVVSTVMMATLVIGPFYLTRALGLGSAQAGLVMSAGPLVAALAGIPAGRLVDRFGAHRVVIAGLAGLAVGLAVLSQAPALFGAVGYIGAIAIVTAHYALFQAANITAIMAGADAARRGLVSGMLNLSRNFGLITGASVMGAVFAHAAGTAVIATASAEAIANGMRTTFTVAALLVAAALAVAAKLNSTK